jgi:small subunit ribosomal protein S11
MVDQLKHSLKQKQEKIGAEGRIHVKSTFSNTLINVSDTKGNTLFFASAGGCGFKGRKKNTPFAAQLVAQKVANLAMDRGMRMADVFFSGPGKGIEASLYVFKRSGLRVISVQENSPQPHNGCRLANKRRLRVRKKGKKK